MRTHQPHVFISYQRTDGDVAQQVRDQLVAAGVTTWMDQFDIPVGAYWPDAIDAGLSSSDIIVGILSPDAVASRNVKNEWDWAIQNNKRLLLLQVEPCVIPHRYVSINFIDATTNVQRALDALLETLGVEGSAPSLPKTRYARSGDVSIAYQVVGDGPVDLVYVPGFVSNVELNWEEPSYARYLQQLASFTRLIVFDKRGTGLSDRMAGVPNLEQRMDDVRAVMDAAGSVRAFILGSSEGAPMSVLFAATYPDRVHGLVLYGSFASGARSPDYPFGMTREQNQEAESWMMEHWGTSDLAQTLSQADDRQFQQWLARYLRLSASPAAALALSQMNVDIDVRNVLPSVRVPTLVVHRAGDQNCPVEGGRYVAAHIPGAELVVLPGDDHIPYIGDQDSIVNTIRAFVTRSTHGPLSAGPDLVLATVLALTLPADQGVSGRRPAILETIAQHRGTVWDATSVSVIATFDGPARAIRCAAATVAATPGDTDIRAGLHTGEAELHDDHLGGIPVAVAIDLARLAAAREVLVTSAVKDLVAGSGIRFSDRGLQVLGGLPEAWSVLAVDLTDAHAGHR